jgi:hypothetical protein
MKQPLENNPVSNEKLSRPHLLLPFSLMGPETILYPSP